MSFIAVVAMSVVKVLGGHSSSSLTDQAAAIGSSSVQQADTVSDGGTSGGMPGGSGGGAVEPAATTRAPSSTAGTTATTTPTATVGSLRFGSATTSVVKSNWSATTALGVLDNLGAPVVGARVAVSVSAYTRIKGGKWEWQTTFQELTTDSDGTVTPTIGPYRRKSGTNQVTEVRVEVSGVTLSGDLAWDGLQPTLTIVSP